MSGAGARSRAIDAMAESLSDSVQRTARGDDALELRDEVAGVAATSCDPAHSADNVLDREDARSYWATTGSLPQPLFVEFRCPVRLDRLELDCSGVVSVVVAGLVGRSASGPADDFFRMGGAASVPPGRIGAPGLGQRVIIALDEHECGAVRRLRLTLCAQEHFCQVGSLSLFGAPARREAPAPSPAVAAARGGLHGPDSQQQQLGRQQQQREGGGHSASAEGGVAVQQVQLFGKARGGVRPNHKMITPKAF